jgi:hypothetical protein
MKKNFEKNVLIENFLLLRNHFLGNSLDVKNFSRNILVQKFLLLQSHFLGNSLDTKNIIIIFLVENFLSKNICLKIFWSKIVYSLKIISSEVVGMKHFLFENCLVTFSYCQIIISLGTVEMKKIFEKMFWWKFSYCCTISSDEKSFGRKMFV